MSKLQTMTVDINKCARCGANHKQLEFTELTQSQNEWGWWAPCPTNHQPLMMASADGDKETHEVWNEDAVDFMKCWRAKVGYIVLAQDEQGKPLSILYAEDGLDKAKAPDLQNLCKSLKGLLDIATKALAAIPPDMTGTSPVEGGCPRNMGGVFADAAEKAYWRKDHTCSYCGGLNPVEATRLIREEGARCGGTSKSYKIYLHRRDEEGARLPQQKVYFQHFDQPAMDAFNAATQKCGCEYGSNCAKCRPPEKK